MHTHAIKLDKYIIVTCAVLNEEEINSLYIHLTNFVSNFSLKLMQQ